MLSEVVLQPARELLCRAVRSPAPVALAYHGDADGIASAALLWAALERMGGRVVALTPSKGENVYGATFREELGQLAASALVLLDTGSRPEASFTDRPSMVIDHHACEAPPQVSSFVHDTAARATAELVHTVASPLADVADRAWLAALGLLGDAGDAAERDPLVVAARGRFGMKPLRDLVALVNAAGRSSLHAPHVALDALRSASAPDELVRGEGTHARTLRAMRAEVAEASARARRVAPRIQGRWAIIELDEPCRIHGVIASAWSRRLSPRIVLVANRGYVAGRVHLSVRCAVDIDLRAALRALLPDAGPDYAAGHTRASGAIVDVPSYRRMLAAIAHEASRGAATAR